MANYCDTDYLDIFYHLGYHTTAQKESMLAVATERIDDETGDSFGDEAATAKLFSGQDETTMNITPRLRALTKVETREDSDSDWVEADLDDILWNKGWIKAVNGIFPRGEDTVRITGDWGWSAVPETIKCICAKMANALLCGRVGDIMTETTQTNAIAKVSDDLSIKRLLAKYKLHKIVVGVVPGRNAEDTPAEDLDEE